MIDSKSKLIKWAIVLFFVFFFGFIPPFGAMTEVGMRVLGIFIGAVFGWTTLGILEVTFIAMIGYGITVGFNTFVASSFGTAMIAMMLIFFPLCGMLNKYGVLEVLAQKFVSNKFCEGHPWRICFMIMLATYVCAPINALVIAILMVAFVRNVCIVAKIPMPSKWSVAMLIGVALAIMTGQLMIPVFGTPLVLVAALGAITGIQVNMVKYMLLLIPVGIVLLFVYVFAMRFVLKVDVTPLKNLTMEALGGKQSFNSDQIKALVITLLTLFALICNSVVPQGTALYTVLSGTLGIFGISLIALGVLLFMKNSKGEPLFVFTECARKGMAWEPFYLAAFIVPFATYMTGGETGIPQTITSVMGPVMGLPPIVFLVIMFFLVTIITNFAQNTVVIIMFLPLFLAYATATGFHMEGFYILLFMVAQLAISTPGSSTPCGIVYSTTDMVDVGMVMRMALKVLPLLFIALMVVGIPLTFLLW